MPSVSSDKMEAAILAKWNKDKLIQEILKLRENKRSSLNTSNLQQDEITEPKKRLRKKTSNQIENSEELYTTENPRMTKQCQKLFFLRGQNEKKLTNYIDGNKDKET